MGSWHSERAAIDHRRPLSFRAKRGEKPMSAVTAVPIQPLPKGSVLKLWIGVAVLVAAGLALAWFGTRGLQRERTEPGMQYQVVEAGDGPSITDADLVQFHLVAR